MFRRGSAVASVRFRTQGGPSSAVPQPAAATAAVTSPVFIQQQSRHVIFGHGEKDFKNKKELPFAKEIKKEKKTDQVRGAKPIFYQTDPEFDPPSLGFFFEGVDGEFKDELRDFIKSQAKVYLYDQASTSAVPMDLDQQHLQNIAKLRHLARKQLVSLVQAKTRPRELCSFLEVLSTLDVNLSLSALQQYFMFGAIINEFGEKHHRDWVNLDKVDAFQTIGCFASAELGSETAPFITKAGFRSHTRELVLNSLHPLGNKFGVVNAATASWAIVTVSFQDLAAPQLVLARIRDDNGQLMSGVHFQPLGDTVGLNGCGIGVFRFENYTIDYRAFIPTTHRLDEEGNLEPKTTPEDPLDRLGTYYRLGSMAIAMGKAKRLATDLTSYLTNRVCVGGSLKHDYPLLGFQRNQDVFIRAFSSLMCLAQLQISCTQPYFDKPNKERTTEEDVRLVLVQMKALKLCDDLCKVSSDLLGHHHYVSANGALQASALSAYCYAVEGSDREGLVRQLSAMIVDEDLGAKKLAPSMQFARALPSWCSWVRHYCANPVFKTGDDEGAFEIMQNLQGLRLIESKRQMRRSLKIENTYGPDEAHFFMHSYKYRECKAVTDAYFDHYLTQQTYKLGINSREIENRMELHTCAKHQAAVTSDDLLVWLLANGWIASTFLWIYKTRQVALANRIAVQTVHYTKLFKIPDEFRRSPISFKVADSYAIGGVPVVDPKEKVPGKGYWEKPLFEDHIWEEGD